VQEDDIVKVQLTPDITIEIDASPEGVRRINDGIDKLCFTDICTEAAKAEDAGVDMTDIEAIYRFYLNPDRDPYDTTFGKPDWTIWWQAAMLMNMVWMWKEMYGSYDVLYSNPNFQIDWAKGWETPCPWSEPPK